MPDSSERNKQREYAWNYFQLHAGQRMASFNFFVVIAALLAVALAGALKKDSESTIVGIAVGLSLMGVSFVFWKLDQRVRYLIKHAEAALKTLEDGWQEEGGDTLSRIMLFRAEEKKTSELKQNQGIFPFGRHF